MKNLFFTNKNLIRIRSISSFYKIVSFDNNFIQDYKTKYLDSADRIFIINTITADIVDIKLDLENMLIAIYLI